jgi:excisionase family DNA binding protein
VAFSNTLCAVRAITETHTSAETLTSAETQLLTTGQVAKLLGTSRQHVVDLCNAGDLPYVTVGRHRRVSHLDVEVLRSAARRLTRDQLRSLWFCHAAAAAVVRNPDTVLQHARGQVQRMLRRSARGAATVWLQQWLVLLDGPVEDVLEALTSRSPRARELRQHSPFAEVLTDDERRTVLASFETARHARTASR